MLWEKHVHQTRHILHSCLMWNLFPVKMLDVPKQLIPRTTIHLSLPEIKGVPGTWAISFKTGQTGMSWSFSYPKSAFPHAQPKVSSSLKALRHPRPRCTPNQSWSSQEPVSQTLPYIPTLPSLTTLPSELKLALRRTFKWSSLQVVLSLSGPFSQMLPPTWGSLTLEEKGSQYQASQKPGVFHFPTEFIQQIDPGHRSISYDESCPPPADSLVPEKVEGRGGTRISLFVCSLLLMIGDCQSKGQLGVGQEGSRCKFLSPSQEGKGGVKGKAETIEKIAGTPKKYKEIQDVLS